MVMYPVFIVLLHKINRKIKEQKNEIVKRKEDSKYRNLECTMTICLFILFSLFF